MAYRKALTGLAAVIAAIFMVGASNAVAGDGDLVSKYDKDNDKSLDLNEVTAAASAHFDKLNKDGDSTLETKEVKGVMGPSAFKAADADHDGTLSKDEYLALVAKLFKQADSDHDGTLTAAEFHSKSGRSLKRLIN
jgi:Ca2+-binding EF-hand superfamily protein